MGSSRRLVIGVDVGGTFTDIVCSDQQDTWRAKSPTVPSNFGAGVLAGCELVAKEIGLSAQELLAQTVRFGLGTTAVTNVFAAQKGCRVGLLTTAGFEEHFHTARGMRESNDGWLETPWNPMSRNDVVGINERIDRDGKIQKKLDKNEIEAAAKYLVEEKDVETIAVSFLWSFLNPSHEQEAAKIISKLYPQIQVFCGSTLNPVLREYERTREAVLSAYAFGALSGVSKLADDLRSMGLTCPLLLLHSGGGAMSIVEAEKAPLHLAYSGPASGAMAAAEVAREVGAGNAICFDVGGTSVDVCVINQGEPERKSGVEDATVGSGLSSVNVGSVGAGGGSIVWADDRGMLRIGPRSARAEPGPACYGRGGTEPTVTDAMLLLGYIDPDNFIGGSLKLDVKAAEKAFESLGKKIGMTAIEAAHGAREIAIVEMSRPLRGRLAASGVDPRDFALIAFGGSGSLFASAVAQELNVKKVYSPKLASVLSAFGAASANLRRERSQAVLRNFPFNAEEILPILSELEAAVNEDLSKDGVSDDTRKVHFEAELRIQRQKSSVVLELEGDGFDSDNLVQRFTEAHEARYGKGTLGSASLIELSTLRAIGIGTVARASFPSDQQRNGSGKLKPAGERSLWLNKEEVKVPTFAADELRLADEIVGPALIDAADTCVWVPDKAKLVVEPGQTINITNQ